MASIIRKKVGKIDLVILANDARTLTFGELPIVASTDGSDLKDYDQYLVDEIMGLDEDTLMSLSSFYALDMVAEAIRTKGLEYTLTKKQEDILKRYYNTKHTKKGDISELIIGKQRNGYPGHVEVMWDPDKLIFSEIHQNENYQ